MIAVFVTIGDPVSFSGVTSDHANLPDCPEPMRCTFHIRCDPRATHARTSVATFVSFIDCFLLPPTDPNNNVM
jgi:hypothetical protein